MATEILVTLTGLFCTTVSSIVTFVLTKRKYNTEVESQQIQNLNEAFDAYKKTMKDTYEAQSRKIEMLEKENENLRQTVNQLQMKMVECLIGKVKQAESTKPNDDGTTAE